MWGPPERAAPSASESGIIRGALHRRLGAIEAVEATPGKRFAAAITRTVIVGRLPTD